MQDSCQSQESSLKLTKASEESIATHFDQELYQSAVGKLLYRSTRARPDIAFAVSTADKLQQNQLNNIGKQSNISFDILLLA